jgi:hypothetical protein
MVAVYSFRVWDSERGEYTSPPVKATAEYIRKAKGETIQGTTRDVEPSALDEQGRYDRQRAGR